jgi:MOSC domain-containing protein YiiM
MTPGALEENLTIQGLLETNLCIDDVLAFGGLVLQATCPQIPCFRLGNKLHKPDILKAFLHSGRNGFYFRVLTEDSISAGAAIKIMERDPRKITVRALLGIHRSGKGDRKSIESALEIDALPLLVRKALETRFAKSRELK